MSLTASISKKSPIAGVQTYELKSEFLKASLPRNQKTTGMFMIWLNTLCAAFLTVGILGARNPTLFTFRLPPPEEAPPFIELKPETDSEKPKPQAPVPDETLPDTLVDQLPVVVPIPVLDIKDVSFARPVEGLVVVDTKKIGTFERKAPNIGVIGETPKPGNPNAQVKPLTTAGGGRRRLTADDVDYGPPVPRPQVNKHGRVEIDPNTKIWVTFGDDGAVSEVRIEPSFSHPGYEREVRAHIRKYWRSKIGANSGWAPVN